MYNPFMLTEDAKVAAFLRQCRMSGFSREKMQMIKEALDPTSSVSYDYRHDGPAIPFTKLKPYIHLSCSRFGLVVRMLRANSNWKLIKLAMSDDINDSHRFSVAMILSDYPFMERYIELSIQSSLLKDELIWDEYLCKTVPVKNFLAENPNTEFDSLEQIQSIAELWK